MGLALLPFFQFFRGTPHQLAAIKQLEESMPAELLEEHEADWFQAWKESGYDQQIYMPYFRQLDNETGTGYRECFSSAAAMVAAYYKKVRTDDEYNAIRSKFGDTTSVEAQLTALRSLGLEAEFRKDGDADMVELEIEAGRPVLVGWLHAGNMLWVNLRCVMDWDVGTGASSTDMQEKTVTTRNGFSAIQGASQTWSVEATQTLIWGAMFESDKLRSTNAGKPKGQAPVG